MRARILPKALTLSIASGECQFSRLTRDVSEKGNVASDRSVQVAKRPKGQSAGSEPQPRLYGVDERENLFAVASNRVVRVLQLLLVVRAQEPEVVDVTVPLIK